MAKAKKSTKKFVRTKLQSELKKRKNAAPYKKAAAARRGARGPSNNDPVNDKDLESAMDVFQNEDSASDGESEDLMDDSLVSSLAVESNSESDDLDADSDNDIENDGEEARDQDGDDSINDASDSDDANEEDIEAAIEAHKSQLEDLKAKDPEFYKFLAENDADLLDFGESDQEDEAQNGAADSEPEVLGEDGQNSRDDDEDMEIDDGDQAEGDDDDEDRDDDLIPLTKTLLLSWYSSLQKVCTCLHSFIFQYLR